jgi:hypothetical protein
MKMAIIGKLFIATSMHLWSSSESKEERNISQALAWAMTTLL